jgi:hypothetical protein
VEGIGEGGVKIGGQENNQEHAQDVGGVSKPRFLAGADERFPKAFSQLGVVAIAIIALGRLIEELIP